MQDFGVSLPHSCGRRVFLEVNFSVIANTYLYKFYTGSCLSEISKETVILYQWKET